MNRIREYISSLPIKISGPLLLTAPVLIAVIILSTLAFIQGKAAVNDLAFQNLAQINERINSQLKIFLKMPARINHINARLIQENRLELSNLRQWRTSLYEQTQAFEMLSGILWGGEDGRVVWMFRYPGQTNYEFGIKDEQTQQTVHEFSIDSQGEILKKSGNYTGYDPRIRPWYKAAIKEGKPTWSEIYLWTPKDGSAPDLGIAYAQPIKDKNNVPLGVLGAEISLFDISQFLSTLNIGKTGQAFLINSKGYLIATSKNISLTDVKQKQILASDSQSVIVSQIALHLKKTYPTLDKIRPHYQNKIQIKGQSHLLRVSPLDDPDLSWFIVTLVPESDFMAQIETGFWWSLTIAFFALLLTIILGIGIAVAMTRPILSLVEHVRLIGTGELEKDIKLNQTPEFAQLSSEINSMTEGLRDRLRMRHSLALAMEVQQSLLPSTTPNIEGLDIFGHSIYCDETGGDYYDFLDISDLSSKAIAIAVGDVAGHGIAAAMFMATARGIIRSRCQEPGSIAELLTHINHLLEEDAAEGHFMTMQLMTIDLEHTEMRWASAGHGPPLVYNQKEKSFTQLSGGGMPLGILEQEVYEEYTFNDIRPGQIYVAMTDGLWEARNEQEEMFGHERLCKIIEQYAHLSAREISHKILKAMEVFREEAHQDDDITFVIVKVIE